MRPDIMEGILNHKHSIGGLENIKLLEIEPGHSKLEVPVIPESLNIYGNAHGGFLFTLCDIASGMAAYAYEVANVTHTSSIQFLKGISTGKIFVEANAVHKGRNTAVFQVEIRDEKDTLLVTATFTMFLMAPL